MKTRPRVVSACRAYHSGRGDKDSGVVSLVKAIFGGRQADQSAPTMRTSWPSPATTRGPNVRIAMVGRCGRWVEDSKEARDALGRRRALAPWVALRRLGAPRCHEQLRWAEARSVVMTLQSGWYQK